MSHICTNDHEFSTSVSMQMHGIGDILLHMTSWLNTDVAVDSCIMQPSVNRSGDWIVAYSASHIYAAVTDTKHFMNSPIQSDGLSMLHFHQEKSFMYQCTPMQDSAYMHVPGTTRIHAGMVKMAISSLASYGQ